MILGLYQHLELFPRSSSLGVINAAFSVAEPILKVENYSVLTLTILNNTTVLLVPASVVPPILQSSRGHNHYTNIYIRCAKVFYFDCYFG